MDRRVKERLIGASILVALIVLVVPELLSGPKTAAPPATLPTMFPANAPEPTRNVTLDLATSKAPANSEVEPAASAAEGGETSASPRASAAPQATASPAAGSPGAGSSPSAAPTRVAPATAAPPTAAPAATPKPVETAAPTPISARASWAVQLGSFASRANADNLSRQLKGQGFSVYVLPGGSTASVRYRVRVGPLADRDSAERMAAKLKSIGHASSLVAPAR